MRQGDRRDRVHDGLDLRPKRPDAQREQGVAQRRGYRALPGPPAANQARLERSLVRGDVVEQCRHGRHAENVANGPVRAAFFPRPLESIGEFQSLFGFHGNILAAWRDHGYHLVGLLHQASICGRQNLADAVPYSGKPFTW